jgi:hypothetical protein
MYSPALALGWELWTRHRLGLSVVAAGGIVAGVLVRVLPDDGAHTVAGLTLPLIFFVYLYLLSIFVYAEGTLGGKAAGFPPRLFALPLRTSLLVAWPMLYGTVTVALLWLGGWCLIVAPGRQSSIVVWWPALLLASCLACFQAVCWTLVRSPLLRLVVAILGLPSVVLGVVLALAWNNIQVTLTQAALIMGAAIAAAYAVAVAGVARDRRGDRLDWAWVGRLLLRAVPRRLGTERPFASAAAAQHWMEVRRQAWLLPAFVGLFVAMLFWAMALPLGPAEVARVAAALVGVPCLLAFFIGFGMGKTSFWAKDMRLSSFIAARPLTSAGLASAKLYAAGLSALATWALVLLLAPLWAVVSGNVEAVRDLGAALFHDLPGWKLGLLVPAAVAGLVGLTWLQLVAGLCLSLTGRAAVVNGVVLLYAAVGTTLAVLGIWNASHGDFFDTLLTVVWCLAGGLGILKLAAVGWAWGRWGCWNDRKVACLAVWLAVAACLVVPLYAAFPGGPVPTHLIALFVVLALPLARLLALPAAVVWNRHR